MLCRLHREKMPRKLRIMLGKTATVTTSASGKVFPGQYYDEETGLHDNGHRTYDPSTGRYLTADPIGLLRDYSDPQLQVAIEAGALEVTGFAGEELNHPYGYVSQNPLYWIDPYGLAKGGKQNLRDSRFMNLTDEQLRERARSPDVTKEERRAAQREEKFRKLRNKNKRIRKGNLGKIKGVGPFTVGPLVCEMLGPSPFNPFCLPEPPPNCDL